MKCIKCGNALKQTKNEKGYKEYECECGFVRKEFIR
jgi:DNA-directed RNA polymerase subunit RPC12/RpoP